MSLFQLHYLKGEITDKGRRNDFGRCERSRKYEDDPDFIYSGTESEKTQSPNGETPSSNGDTDYQYDDSALDEEIRPPSSNNSISKLLDNRYPIVLTVYLFRIYFIKRMSLYAQNLYYFFPSYVFNLSPFCLRKLSA